MHFSYFQEILEILPSHTASLFQCVYAHIQSINSILNEWHASPSLPISTHSHWVQCHQSTTLITSTALPSLQQLPHSLSPTLPSFLFSSVLHFSGFRNSSHFRIKMMCQQIGKFSIGKFHEKMFIIILCSITCVFKKNWILRYFVKIYSRIFQ